MIYITAGLSSGRGEILMGGLSCAACSSKSQCWVPCLCTQPFELRCGHFAPGTLVCTRPLHNKHCEKMKLNPTQREKRA